MTHLVGVMCTIAMVLRGEVLSCVAAFRLGLGM